MTLLLALALVAQITGFIFAAHAVLYARSPQGAIAWAVSLATFPYLSIPLYVVFGNRKFEGYIKAQRVVRRSRSDRFREILQNFGPRAETLAGDTYQSQQVYERLAELPFTRGNTVKLFVDGEKSFDAIFEAIDAAQHSVLLEYYIVQDDELGRKLQSHLIAKLQAGIKVLFLYDEIGSFTLSNSYISEIVAAGGQMSSFSNLLLRRGRRQVNFRNHRKLVVVDGKVAFVGGYNVGDSYLGKDRYLGYWRDTQVRVSGPAALALQLSFLGDWYWATREIPQLSWEPVVYSDPEHEDYSVLPLPTGPADDVDSGELAVLQAIHSATCRCWIATPYFVPNESIEQALILAAMRGVDVRVLIAEKTDNQLVRLASFSYIESLLSGGVKMLRYQNGFLHQKAILIDHHLVSIGSANIDNRSLRLNFELNVLVWSERFAKEAEAMFENDFQRSRVVHPDDYARRPWYFKVAVGLSRLCAPIL